jgi:DNA primase
MVPFDRMALGQMQETAERYADNLASERNKGAQEYLEGRGITAELARRYLLGICDDIYPGRLSIPYLRPSGTVWFNFRALDDHKPKYMASGARHLYNTAALDQADSTGVVAIAEGELDALVATELCGVPCVGVPGATQWTGNKHWRELFVGYPRVWMLADPDDAGRDLAEAILSSLPAARLVDLPADVNETFLKHGGIKEFMNG